MWDLSVSVPDHCLSLYFDIIFHQTFQSLIRVFAVRMNVNAFMSINQQNSKVRVQVKFFRIKRILIVHQKMLFI